MVERLKQLREEAGLSQRALAKEIETTQQIIHRYENMEVALDAALLKKLADYFNTSIDYIIGHTEFRSKAGAAGDYHLDSSEAELIALFRTLTDEQKACIEMTARTFAKK